MKIILKTNNEFHFSINENLYNEKVIYKCFYWYGADYSVDIERKDNSFKITISSKSDIKIDHDYLTSKIKQDLIDFKLRDIVTNETKNIRELLTAKAFAHFQTDEDPLTEISDPVGFDPAEF